MPTITSDPQPKIGSPWALRIVAVLLAVVVIPVGVSILYTFSPSEYSFLPCMFNQLTGWHCPGCGATRCCHALLHGDLEQAFAWNPLLVLLTPMLCYVAARTTYGMWTGKPAPGYRFPLWTTYFLLWTMLAYWIARNIPVEPFTFLAPHPVTARFFS